MSDVLTRVDVYTDGAARGNPEGPGGYGTILRFVDSKGNIMKENFRRDISKPPTIEWSLWLQ